MSVQVLLKLSDLEYERVRIFARLRHQDISRAIVEHLTETIPTVEIPHSPLDTRAKQSEALAREEAAYITLFPQLRVTHRDLYVAIYNGKLIDSDKDFGAMVERVRDKLPDQVVWMAQVKDEPIQTIVKRGNRILNSSLIH